MAFLGDDYLLGNNAAKSLYQKVEKLPIVDAHNHGDVREIVENKGWDDIWEVEAATDHYVWELMRKRGVPEEKITGKASNKEKWLALAEVFPSFAGNPTYEWVHLDLKRRFGIEEVISRDTALQIWEETEALLKEERMKPRNLLKEMRVEVMCTTDSPTSTLDYHLKARDEITGLKILPTWRPDQAMNIDKKGWEEFVRELGNVYGKDTTSLNGFLEALEESHKQFASAGCVASDHGLEEPLSYYVSPERAAGIHSKGLAGKELTPQDVKDYKAFMFVNLVEMNVQSNWVTQLHIGAVRDYRTSLFNELGPDSGGDISRLDLNLVDNLRYFLNHFDGKLKIVLYCLDPGHLPTLATLSRAYPNVTIGAAWWFNDSPFGMGQHLKYIATVDLLSNQAGMVTDSRKLISYGSRTEMFRRVLCNVVGEMVESEQMPYTVAENLVADLSYYRPLNLFFK